MTDLQREDIDWKQFGVFTSEAAFNEVLIVYIIATLGFTVAYYANQFFLGSFFRAVLGEESPYFQMSEKHKKEYWSRNISDLHALIAAPMAYYAAFHPCEDETKSIFSSQQCLNTPARCQIWLIAISTGYVTYDTFICVYELGYGFKYGFDNIAHHIVGIFGAFTSLVAGQFCIALSSANLFSEWTTFPMNQRWRMLKHKQVDSPLYMVVNAIFFFGYCFARIVFMGMLLLRNYQIQQNVDISKQPDLIYFCVIISTVLQVTLYLLQCFWFRLIFGAFLRALHGQKPAIASKDD